MHYNANDFVFCMQRNHRMQISRNVLVQYVISSVVVTETNQTPVGIKMYCKSY